MAYCTIADVNKLTRQAPFDASSVPTSDDVQDLCDEISRRVDATLANLGYVVPVTNATALLVLGPIVTKGVCGEALQMRDTGVQTAINDRGVPSKNIWTRMFEEYLCKLADNDDPFELPSADRTGQKVIKQSQDLLRSMVQDDVDRFVDNPTVTRDQVL